MLIAFVPLVAFAGLLVAKRGRNLPWIVIVFLFSAAASALLAGAEPVMVFNHQPKRINVVVDNSAATATAFFRHPHVLRQFIEKHLPHGTHIRIGFAGHFLHGFNTSQGSSARDTWPKQFPSSTARHMNWRALAGSHLSGPIWIFTSPFNSWPVMPPSRPTALSLFRPQASDISVCNLRVRQVGDGTVDLGIGIRASGPIQAVLNVRRDSVPIARQTVKFLRRGERIIELVDHPPDPSQWLHYQVQLQSPDPWPVDNHGSIALPPARPVRILWVTNRPDKKPNSRTIRLVKPGNLPSHASELVGYQCVVLDNIASWDIDVAQAAALEHWVRDNFGGLVMVGARRAFGAGGYAEATTTAQRLNALSPLSSHSPHPSSVGIVFLIDTSGSMGKRVPDTGGQTRYDLAVAGVLDAVHLLGPRVRVQVLAFSGKTVRIRSRTPSQLKHCLTRIEPSGSTRPDTALPILRRILRRHDWLILLTDGGIPKMSSQPWRHLIKANAGHMVIIAGRESRAIRAFLHTPRVKLLKTSNELRWRFLLRKAARRVQESRVRRTRVQWTTTSAGGSHLEGVTHDWVRTYIRRRAILLAGNNRQQLPLAAYWRVGLGKVAAMAFSGGSRADQALLKRLIQFSAAGAENSHWHLSLHEIQFAVPSAAGIANNGPKAKRWRLRVSADLSRGMSRKLRAIVFNSGRRRVLALSMIAPAVYQTYFTTSGRDSYVTVMSARQSINHSPSYRLIGRIWPLDISGPWFPATGSPSQPAWKGCVMMRPHMKPGFIWRPQVKDDLAAADWLWILAAICGAGAMIAGSIKSLQLGGS